MIDLSAGRPGPTPSRLTEEFWAATARHELVHPRCDDCGHAHFTPQAVCTSCLSASWSYVRSAGRGEVYSCTVVHRAPLPGMEAPYLLAIVDLLDEGWSMLTNIVAPADAPVAIGTPVHVEWLDLADGTVLPVFAPDLEPAT